MKKYLLFVALMIVGLCLLGTPAQAAYYDAINYNMGDGDGAVTGTIYTTQSPAAFGSNWNNFSERGQYMKGWDTTPSQAGAIGWNGGPTPVTTSNGTAVAVGGGTKFNVGFYAQDYWAASGSWNTGGPAGLLNQSWTGKSGQGGVWIYASVVPFTSYDFFYLTGDGVWHNAGSYTGNAAYQVTGSWGSATIAALQILSKDAPPTGSLRINKWNDLDGDGEWLSPDNDPLLGGWTFNVSDVSPTLTDNGPLDEDSTPGTILVTGLAPGQYTIMESLVGHDGWNWTHGLLVATVNPGEEAVADWANHYTPPGVAEPAGLGLIGVALLALRKRRS